jgi:hypothetical protein
LSILAIASASSFGFKNLVGVYKARAIPEGQRKKPQRDIQNPLGAFIFDPSGKPIP